MQEEVKSIYDQIQKQMKEHLAESMKKMNE